MSLDCDISLSTLMDGVVKCKEILWQYCYLFLVECWDQIQGIVPGRQEFLSILDSVIECLIACMGLRVQSFTPGRKN